MAILREAFKRRNGFRDLCKRISSGVLMVLLIGLTYMLGFQAGSFWGQDRFQAEAAYYINKPHEEILSYPTGNKTSSVDRQFKVFWEAWEIIDRDFYGPLPDEQERIYGAIRGMINSLGDEHTAFLTPEQADIVSSDDFGSFEGIGASIYVDSEIGYPRIVHSFADQPASNAGLLPGDIIVAVDGKSTENLTIFEVISLIRGPEDSTTQLTVRRESTDKTDKSELFIIPVVRAKVDIPIVETETLPNNIAFIRLADFNNAAAGKFREALKRLLAQNPRGLVLDLRDNPGGFLHVAVEISSQFIAQGNIVIETTKDGTETAFPAQPGGLAIDPSLALTVLVNEGTASAAEIVAAAIQDLGRGILIGTATFGKASVQMPYQLGDGSELRVTVARWISPNGNMLEKGLKPDIEIEMTLDDVKSARDPQKKRAIEYLTSKFLRVDE